MLVAPTIVGLNQAYNYSQTLTYSAHVVLNFERRNSSLNLETSCEQFPHKIYPVLRHPVQFVNYYLVAKFRKALLAFDVIWFTLTTCCSRILI